MTKPQYVTVSFSGGKDSTAMLLHMMELGEHIDEVINVDTGMEFPAMYDHIAKVREIVKANGIKYTELRADHTFEYYLMEAPPTAERPKRGMGWPGVQIRWCTKWLKTQLIKDYLKGIEDTYNLVQCVGLAYDEQDRRERENNKNQRHPLAEWGWTEADALTYCYDKGYDWGGLYRHFRRVSCWCCPLQPLASLRTLYNEYPAIWEMLEDMDDRIRNDPKINDRKFRKNATVADLSRRFAREARAHREQRTLDIFGGIE